MNDYSSRTEEWRRSRSASTSCAETPCASSTAAAGVPAARAVYPGRDVVFYSLRNPRLTPFHTRNTHYSGLIGPVDADVDAAVNWSDVRAAAIAEVIR